MLIKIYENGIVPRASAVKGTIVIDARQLEWSHPVGPCRWEVSELLPVPAVRTQISKLVGQRDANDQAERQRQAVLARAVVVLDWVETAPQ